MYIFSIASIFLIRDFNSTKLFFLLILNCTFKKEGAVISIKFFDFIRLIISSFISIIIFV